jgi:hypothetical protein
MKKKKTLWRLWAKSLGEKASKNDRESDHIAGIRTVIFGTYLLTNLFIIAGVIRHWNDGPTINLYYYEVPSHLSQTKEESILKANRSFLYD